MFRIDLRAGTQLIWFSVKSSTLLMQVGVARNFSPRGNFQCRLLLCFHCSWVLLCAVACGISCVHIKNPRHRQPYYCLGTQKRRHTPTEPLKRKWGCPSGRGSENSHMLLQSRNFCISWFLAVFRFLLFVATRKACCVDWYYPIFCTVSGKCEISTW